jgi:hypothetical protein
VRRRLRLLRKRDLRFAEWSELIRRDTARAHERCCGPTAWRCASGADVHGNRHATSDHHDHGPGAEATARSNCDEPGARSDGYSAGAAAADDAAPAPSAGDYARAADDAAPARTAGDVALAPSTGDVARALAAHQRRLPIRQHRLRRLVCRGPKGPVQLLEVRVRLLGSAEFRSELPRQRMRLRL